MPDLRGNERFERIRRLGAGGMGVVFEALDHESGGRVALKALPVLEPHALARFKSEFRLLRDIRHPNLVGLRELVEDRGEWFFTMELVEGLDVLTYVRYDAGSVNADTETLRRDISAVRNAPPLSTGAPGFHEARLRATLRQLARGLSALHAAGRVHRDVKPSNILVTSQGRVVLLDFGLAVEVDPGKRLTGPDQVVGTVAYMAPEQSLSAPVGPPADWYAVGIVLYEVLTGILPFQGRSLDIFLEKQRGTPPSPSSLVPGLPADLEKLCIDLLHPDPAARPAGRDVLDRLGAERVEAVEVERAAESPWDHCVRLWSAANSNSARSKRRSMPRGRGTR